MDLLLSVKVLAAEFFFFFQMHNIKFHAEGEEIAGLFTCFKVIRK